MLFEAEAETEGSAFTVTACVAVLVQPLAAVPVTVYVVFALGVTVTEVPLSDPGIQVYVAAPLPVSVVVLPAQMVPLEIVAVTFGVAFTVMTCVAVFEQPAETVPVTVYVVVVVGETVTEVPLSDPGIHVYVVAPLPVSVAELPEQIVAPVEEIDTVGCAPTVMATVLVPVQPLPAVPVRVYVVVEPGVTVTEEPLSEPGIHP